MATYQELRAEMSLALAKNHSVAMMNREQIFEYLAELVLVSDSLTDFIREIDKSIHDIEIDTRTRLGGTCSAAMLNQQIKLNTSTLIADKDWANKQLALLKDLRITALAAQRTTE